MKKFTMKKFAIAIALAGFSLSAMGGPFGLREGMSMDELKKHGNFEPAPTMPFVFTTKKLANGHVDFDNYLMIVTPKQGLCRIIASSKAIFISNEDALEIKALFLEFSDALIAKYGPPAFNYSHQIMITGAGKNFLPWLEGIFKGERVRQMEWKSTMSGGTKSTKPDPASDSIRNIIIRVEASSESEGYIHIIYDFRNLTECSQFMKDAKNKNL